MAVSTFMSDDPNVVTHRTPTSHWCAACWSWVVDCIHLVQPLRIPHGLTPGDFFIRSLAYDAAGERLEIRFRWKSAAQFRPITAAMFRQITAQTNVYPVLNKWIKERSITWSEVRTERKIVASMLCGFRLVVERLGI